MERALFRRLDDFTAVEFICTIFITSWGFVYRYVHGLALLDGYNYRVGTLLVTWMLLHVLHRWSGRMQRRSQSYFKISESRSSVMGVVSMFLWGCALCIILASMAIHIISFTYPNTAFGSSTIACYVLNLTVVLSFANIFNTVQHLIIWISSVIPSMMFVIWYGNTMEFVVSNLVSMVMGLTVTLVIGGYSQRCTKRSWNSISLASERLLGDRRKELLPGDVLMVLQRLHVSKWHEISKAHDSVAVVFVSVKNLPDLVLRLSPNELVTVLHTVFSVCDRILRTSNRDFHTDLTKIETVHDTYLVASGLLAPSKRSTLHAYSFATEVVYALNGLSVTKLVKFCDSDISDLKILISGGVAVGPVLTGVVGRFCIFGSTVNTAARLMQHADPGTVRVVADENESLFSNSETVPVPMDGPLSSSIRSSSRSLSNRSMGVASMLNVPEHSMARNYDLFTVRFRIQNTMNMVCKGIGETTCHVLEHCDPRRITLPSEQMTRPRSAYSPTLSLSNEDHGGVNSAFETGGSGMFHGAEFSSRSAAVSYKSLAPSLYSTIKMTHIVTGLCYLFYFLLRTDRFSVERAAIFAFIILSSIMAPVMFRLTMHTTHALSMASFIVFWILSADVAGVYAGVVLKSHRCEVPELIIGYSAEIHATQMALAFTIYRLPWQRTSIIAALWCCMDTYITAVFGCDIRWSAARLLLDIFISVLAVLCSQSLHRIDYELADKEYKRTASLRVVKGLLSKMLPAVALGNLSGVHSDGDQLHSDDSNKGVAHYSYSSPIYQYPGTVSPLVAPVGHFQSSSHWQYFDNLCVVQSDIVEFTGSVIKMLTKPVEFFGVIRELFSMMDGCAQIAGLWKMYTVGDAYVAVAGFPGTKSFDKPAESALEFAKFVSKRLERVNQTCRANDFPTLSLRVGLAAGSAVTAIVGEYHPAFLIWGPAPDRAAQMEHMAVAGTIQIHESIYAMVPEVSNFHKNGLPGGLECVPSLMSSLDMTNANE